MKYLAILILVCLTSCSSLKHYVKRDYAVNEVKVAKTDEPLFLWAYQSTSLEREELDAFEDKGYCYRGSSFDTIFLEKVSRDKNNPGNPNICLKTDKAVDKNRFLGIKAFSLKAPQVITLSEGIKIEVLSFNENEIKVKIVQESEVLGTWLKAKGDQKVIELK